MTKDLLAMVKPLKKVVNEDFYVLTNDEYPTEPRTYRNLLRQINGEVRYSQIEISWPAP